MVEHWSLAFRTWYFVAIGGFGAMYYMYAFSAETFTQVFGGVFYVLFAIVSGLVILLFGREIKTPKINWFGLLPVAVFFLAILIGGTLLSGLDQWIPQLKTPVPVFIGSEYVLTTKIGMDVLFALFLVGVGEEVMKFIWIIAFDGQKWAESRVPVVGRVNWLAVGFAAVFWSVLHMFLNPRFSYLFGLMFVGFTSMLVYYWALENKVDALFMCSVIHGAWNAIILLVLFL